MMKKTLLLFALSIIFMGTAMAQSGVAPATEQLFYVQCTDLDFAKYTSLNAQVKADGKFTIATACIPAHVLMIKTTDQSLLSSTVNSNFELFRNLATASGIEQSIFLTDFTSSQFEAQCRNARTGN